MMMQESRSPVPLLRNLEGLRLISSLGIVSVHMFPHAGIRPPEHITLFVDLFFVISGIVIGQIYVDRIERWSDYATFLRRRLARIYPLHLATLLFYVAIGAGVARFHLAVDDPSRFDPGQIVPNLLLVHAWFPGGRLSYNFVSWSISAEFFAYLCFPVIAAAVARTIGWSIVGLLLIVAVSVAVAELALGTRMYVLGWNCALPRVLPSFAFGVFVSRFGPDIARRSSPRALRAVLIASTLATALGMAFTAPGYLLLGALYLLVSTAYLCDLNDLRTWASWRPISDRGYLTYSLYMIHVPVTTVFISFVFPRLIGTTPAARLMSLLFALAILFVVAEASFRLFENPLRKLLR